MTNDSFEPHMRAALIDTLGETGVYLARHAELPVPTAVTVTKSVHGGTHEENLAEVDRIAGLLGKQAGPLGGGAYGVRAMIAPGACYEAVYVVPVENLRPLATVPAQTGAAA